MKDGKLVYSTDSALNQKCARCRELISECVCPVEVDASTVRYVPILRIEKSGRGGKTVTVVDGLPKATLFLKNLTTQLKNKCGSGGTYLMDGKDGLVEIQGDKREVIRAHFAKSGIKTKG